MQEVGENLSKLLESNKIKTKTKLRQRNEKREKNFRFNKVSTYLRSVHKEAINHTPKFLHSNLFQPNSLVFQLKMLIQRSDNIQNSPYSA